MDKGKAKKERWAQVLATGRGITAKKAGKVPKPKMKAAYKPVSKAPKKKPH